MDNDVRRIGKWPKPASTIPPVAKDLDLRGSDSGHGDKPRRACGIVMSGTLALELDGIVHVIGPGDSFAFDATRLHRFWCEGQETVDLLWVVAPAVY
ncbi:cupin domain-containing protein [Bradyrhizobium cenepequi]